MATSSGSAWKIRILCRVCEIELTVLRGTVEEAQTSLLLERIQALRGTTCPKCTREFHWTNEFAILRYQRRRGPDADECARHIELLMRLEAPSRSLEEQTTEADFRRAHPEVE